MNVYRKSAFDISIVKRWSSRINANPKEKEENELQARLAVAVNENNTDIFTRARRKSYYKTVNTQVGCSLMKSLDC